MFRTVLGLLAFGLSAVTSCSAPGDAPGSPSDEAALQAIEQRQADAWAQGNGAEYAATFTEDADFVDVMGNHLHGRAVIAKSLQKGFDTFMSGTRISPPRERVVRFLSEDTAVVITKGVCVLRSGADQCRTEDLSIQTKVAVEQDGTWLVTSFQNNRIKSEGPP